MVRNDFGNAESALWIDISDPGESDLIELGQRYSLDQTSIADCLQPEHLPKYETIDQTEFVILRAFDANCGPSAASAQELSRKIAIFRKPKLLITVHRTDHPILSQMREQWKSRVKDSDSLAQITGELFVKSVTSFDPSIDEALNKVEEIEESIFSSSSGGKSFDLHDAYIVKRRSFVFRRLLRSTSDIFNKLTYTRGLRSQHLQNFRDEVESSLFYTEELTESVTSLINLHISMQSQRTNLASQQTNEVMRVLTVFSVFLLPINVITGFYGMNFEHLPGLKSEYGHYIALALTFVTVSIGYFWFKSKGYIRRGVRLIFWE